MTNDYSKMTGRGRIAETIRRLQEQSDRQRIGSSLNTGTLRRTSVGGTVVRGKPFQRVKLAETDDGTWI